MRLIQRLCAAVAAVMFLAAVVACSGPTSKTDEEKTETVAEAAKQVDWSKVGSKAQVGDTEIECTVAANKQITGVLYGDFTNLGESLAVGFKFTNHSKTRIVKFKGWIPGSRAWDEHGNEYDQEVPPRGFAFSNALVPMPKCDNSHVTAGSFDLQPSTSYACGLLFQRVADVANEMRVLVDAEAFGGKGPLYLKCRVFKK